MISPDTEILGWLRAGFPDRVPDADVPALYAVLVERQGLAQARALFEQLRVEGMISPAAWAALIPEESAKRQVAAKLVLGGWPLSGPNAGGGQVEEVEQPREGSPLGRIVNWLRDGYPGGVPDHDYLPLLALLERRLTRSEVKMIAKALRRADVSPAMPSDIAAAISDYTHGEPSENDIRRVHDRLAKKGWPVEFPDPNS